MDELKPIANEHLPKTDWSFRRDQNVRVILDHIAHILAEEYIELCIHSKKQKTEKND